VNKPKEKGILVTMLVKNHVAVNPVHCVFKKEKGGVKLSFFFAIFKTQFCLKRGAKLKSFC
jgi:hypothetical protein